MGTNRSFEKSILLILISGFLCSCSGITGKATKQKPTAKLNISPKEAKDATAVHFQLSDKDGRADHFKIVIAYQNDFQVVEQGSPIDQTIKVTENAEVIATVSNSEFSDTIRDSVFIFPVSSGNAILSSGASNDVETADLDMDGDIDIVATGGDPSGNVIWFRNNGNGGFGEAITVSDQAKAGSDVTVADINGDGSLDIVTASYWNDEQGKIAWYANEGGANFGEQQVIDDNNLLRPKAVSTADLDNDGDLDVLAGTYKGERAMWYKNDGSGHFGEPILIAETPVICIHTADLNSDGNTDVIIGRYAPLGAGFTVYQNDGSGNLSAEYGDGISTFWDLQLADMDNDDDLDIITVSDIDPSRIYYNKGNFDFQLERIASGHVYGGRDLVVADMDGDSDLDIVSSNHRDSKLLWQKNYLAEKGAGAGFSPTMVIKSTLERPVSAAGGDFNGDGDIDLVIGEELQGDIYTFDN